MDSYISSLEPDNDLLDDLHLDERPFPLLWNGGSDEKERSSLELKKVSLFNKPIRSSLELKEVIYFSRNWYGKLSIAEILKSF